ATRAAGYSLCRPRRSAALLAVVHKTEDQTSWGYTDQERNELVNGPRHDGSTSFHQTAISGFRHLLRRLDQKARADRFFTETGTIGKLGRHRAGTQHGDSNSTRLEFTVQSLGKRQNIGFRCLVNRHPGPGRRKPAIEPTFSSPPRWRARLSTKA